jgi:hypothetical protein
MTNPTWSAPGERPTTNCLSIGMVDKIYIYLNMYYSALQIADVSCETRRKDLYTAN